MAELADALASGASDRKVVWVQVPSPAPVLARTGQYPTLFCGVGYFYAAAKEYLLYIYNTEKLDFIVFFLLAKKICRQTH